MRPETLEAYWFLIGIWEGLYREYIGIIFPYALLRPSKEGFHLNRLLSKPQGCKPGKPPRS